jgi:hypothetical protein
MRKTLLQTKSLHAEFHPFDGKSAGAMTSKHHRVLRVQWQRSMVACLSPFAGNWSKTTAQKAPTTE